MFNNRIKAKAKLYFDVDGESVTASEESLSDAAAKVKCIFRKQLFDPDKKLNHLSIMAKFETNIDSHILLFSVKQIFC